MQREWKVLIVTAVAVFMGFLDVTIVNVAFPDLQKSFADSSRADLSWILNAYNVVFAALLVPAGRLADLLGRRKLFFVGTATFVAASVACAAAPTVEVLVGARVIQAAGAAVLVPTSLGLLLPEFPPERRATATALWGATGAVAAAVGPSLGGVLVNWQGWRWVFLVNLPIGLAALYAARRPGLLREVRDESRGAMPDLLGIALLTAGVGLVALGIVKAEDWGYGDAATLGSVAAGLLALVALVARSRRHHAPVIEVSLFRVRSFGVAVGGVFLFSMGFYALLLCNILFLTQVWHYSVLTAGFAVTPGPLVAALSSVAGGRLSDRFGQRVVALPGGLLFAFGAYLLSEGLGASPAYVSEFLPATVFTGLGVGLSFAAWSSAAVAQLPPALFATGSAISTCLRQIGAVLGIAVLVAVLDGASPADPLAAFHDAYRLAGIAALAAAALAPALGRVRAGAPERARDGAGVIDARSLTLEWQDPMPTAAAAMGRAGLEQMRAIVSGELPPPPMAVLMGMTVAEVDDGHAVFVGQPGEQHFNPIGVVHGGYAATLLDSAMGCAVHTTLPQGRAYTSLEVKVNFVRPIRLDTGPVVAEANVLHRGRQVATAEARLTARESGKLLAHGTTTCQVFDVPAGSA